MRQVRVPRKPYLFEESFSLGNLARSLAVFTPLGMAAGLAMGNPALGISLGAALGLALGMLVDSVSKPGA